MHTASEEVILPGSEEANNSRSTNEPLQSQRDNDDDALSLFGGNDLDVDDSLLECIDESLRPSDSLGPSVAEKVAKLVNEKFSIDLGVEKRKEIFDTFQKSLSVFRRLNQ